MKTKRKPRLQKYYATGSGTVVEKTHINGTNIVLEFNKNVGMWRLNSRHGLLPHLMGYSPHRQALLDKVRG